MMRSRICCLESSIVKIEMGDSVETNVKDYAMNETM